MGSSLGKIMIILYFLSEYIILSFNTLFPDYLAVLGTLVSVTPFFFLSSAPAGVSLSFLSVSPGSQR